MHAAKNKRNNWLIAVIVIIGLAILAGGMYGMRAFAQNAERQGIAQKKQQALALAKKAAAKSSSEKKAALASQKAADASHAKTDPVFKAYRRYGLTYQESQLAKTLPVSAIGDSVMLGSKYGFEEIFKKITVDAAVSRQAYDAPKLTAQMKASGKLGLALIMGLGTNGNITKDEIKQVCTTAGKTQVFWIGPNVPDKPWTAQNNDLLEASLSKYKNLHFIDWYSFSQGHRDWFAGDGIHPSVKGQAYYYTLVAQEVLQTMQHK